MIPEGNPQGYWLSDCPVARALHVVHNVKEDLEEDEGPPSLGRFICQRTNYLGRFRTKNTVGVGATTYTFRHVSVRKIGFAANSRLFLLLVRKIRKS